MPYFIVNPAPATFIDTVTNTIRNLSVSMNPFKVNLVDAQKPGLRTMAEGREGYARMVSQIANNNINSLPRESNPTDLVARLAYDSKLEEARQAVISLLESSSETQTANSMDIMQDVDAYAEVLQVSRKNNASLDLAMQEVDAWNARFGSNTTDKKVQENK
jgi:hypothetical protein